MHIRFLSLTLLVTCAAAPTFAQPIPPLKSLATSTEIQSAIAKAQTDRKGDAAQVTEPLASVPPYRINLEYRFAQNPPSIHDTQNELFYFVNGSGILTVGGTLVDAKRTNANNQRGSGIQGGTEIPVSKGDIYIVPQNTPHMLTPTGGPLIDLSLHLPGSPK
jgi:mannose-6-phosphate isomerase-like protein (cupin superfamily)